MLVAMRSLLILAGLAITFVASAQEIYRWVDKDGVVHFSDQPGSDNAVLIKVIEPNSFENEDSGGDGSGAGAATATEQPSTPDFPPYRGLFISSPAADQVFFGADAVVTATAELDGTLNPDHSVVFFLNGERRDSEGLSMEFANLARGTYFLRASVLDENGKPVISSSQTTFHVRQPSINSPQSPQAPRPQPPRPVPAPVRSPSR
jgi:hypothetical protein